MNIAICDDNEIDSCYVKNLVKKWNCNQKLQINIDIYKSAEEFLFNYEDNHKYDILLLDIEMGEIDGVSLARTIRKSDKNVQIIFITGYVDYISEGYDVEALHYLMKPLKEEKLFSVLDRAIAKLAQNELAIILTNSEQSIKIPLHNIIYISVDRNYVTIHAEKQYKIKKTLAEVQKQLDQRFYRISRSEIVNLKYITRITRTDVYLENGEVLQLPKASYDALNRAIINEM